MISLLFDIEQIMAYVVGSVGIGGFLFTLRHRGFYSVYARSSILIGGITSFLHAYNFDNIQQLVEGTDVALACVIIQIMVSLSLISFTYTILRFKWRWLGDVSTHCSSEECPLVKKYK